MEINEKMNSWNSYERKEHFDAKVNIIFMMLKSLMRSIELLIYLHLNFMRVFSRKKTLSCRVTYLLEKEQNSLILALKIHLWTE
jgi:hypothetical protein